MLTWHYITRDAYNIMSDSLKTADKLFYIKDDNSIINGTDSFREDIILYKNYPTTIIGNKVYIDIDTLAGMIYVGNSYDVVINPVIIDRTDFVDSNDISSIVYDAQYNHLVVTKIDDTEDTIEMYDMTLDINYSNGIFTIVNQRCHLYYGRQIILSDFIDGITYDGNGNLYILFKDSDSSLLVVTDDLLDKGEDINFTITGNSFIAECLLYTNTTTNEIACTNDIYTVYRHNTDSSVDIMNAAISDIVRYMTTIVDTSLSLMTTVGFDKSGEIIVADDEGNAKASGTTIIDIISEDPKDVHVPTEKAIVEYMDENVVVKSDITTYEEFKKLERNDASDRKLASEKTLLEQLSWDVI